MCDVCYVTTSLQTLIVSTVHSVEQKSIGLTSRMSRSGRHVTYSCHHNSSCFTFPMFVHSWHFCFFHSWLKKKGRDLPKAENWPGCDNTVINPELSGGQIPLQDKYCHKSEPHWDYVEWGEKNNAGNLACPPFQK